METSFFSRARSTHIDNGHFNAVGRDQINTTIHGTQVINYSSLEKDWTIEDEYIQVPTGRVKLLEKISEVSVPKKWKDECDLEDKKVIHVVSISNEHPESRFIRVSYAGRNAKKACLFFLSTKECAQWSFIIQLFMEDFKQSSQTKDICSTQLFGFNRSEAFPALLFYDHTLPLGYVMERYGSMPLFFHLLSQINSLEELERTPVRLINGYNNRIWVHSDGRLSRGVEGPGIPVDIKGWYWPHYLKYRPQVDALPIIKYGDEEFLWKGILRSFPGLFLLRCFESYFRRTGGTPRYGSRNSSNTRENSEPPVAVFSHGHSHWNNCEPNRRIAMFLCDQSFKFSGLSHRLTLYMKNKPYITSMEDGSMCLKFTKLVPFNEPNSYISFNYNLESPELAMITWLSQSCSVFKQLHIPHSEWKNYRFITGASLFLQISSLDHSPKEDVPYYLFLRPSMPNGKSKLTSCIFYFTKYWSKDPSGQSAISSEEHKSMGLPDIKLGEKLQFSCWPEEAYDCIEKCQQFNNFDPSTTDFALSLGLPIMDVITGQDILEVTDKIVAVEALEVDFSKSGMCPEVGQDATSDTCNILEPSESPPLTSETIHGIDSSLGCQEEETEGLELQVSTWTIGEYLHIPSLFQSQTPTANSQGRERERDVSWWESLEGFFFV